MLRRCQALRSGSLAAAAARLQEAPPTRPTQPHPTTPLTCTRPRVRSPTLHTHVPEPAHPMPLDVCAPSCRRSRRWRRATRRARCLRWASCPACWRACRCWSRAAARWSLWGASSTAGRASRRASASCSSCYRFGGGQGAGGLGLRALGRVAHGGRAGGMGAARLRCGDAPTALSAAHGSPARRQRHNPWLAAARLEPLPDRGRVAGGAGRAAAGPAARGCAAAGARRPGERRRRRQRERDCVTRLLCAWGARRNRWCGSGRAALPHGCMVPCKPHMAGAPASPPRCATPPAAMGCACAALAEVRSGCATRQRHRRLSIVSEAFVRAMLLRSCILQSAVGPPAARLPDRLRPALPRSSAHLTVP